MRLLAIAMLLLTACSQKPIVDLRSSGDQAQFLQRDMNECQMIIDDQRGIIHAHFLGMDPMMVQCLKGRGHSVLTFN